MKNLADWLSQQLAWTLLRRRDDDEDLHDALLEAPEALRRLSRTEAGRFAIRAVTALKKEVPGLRPDEWRSVATLCLACGSTPQKK